MMDGFSYVLGWRPVAIVVLAASMINFLMAPAFSLLPILVTEHFMGDAAVLAVIQSVLSVGMLSGGLILGAWGGGRRRMVAGLVAVVFVGVALLGIGALPPGSFMVSLPLFLLVGLMASIMNGAMLAVLQSAVPPEMQRRVFSILTSLSGAMVPAGLTFAGPVADLFGVPVWFTAAGLLTFVLGPATLSIGSVRNVDVVGARSDDTDSETPSNESGDSGVGTEPE